MQVKITKSLLHRYLKGALFESMDDDPVLGVDDAISSTIQPEVPVEPSDQMATQLSTERPPIEDDDYVPVTATELGLAADVIGRMVPDDQVEYFYNRLHDLLDNVYERHNDPETLGSSTEKNEGLKYATHLLESLESGGKTAGPGMANLEDIASEFGYRSASGARQDLERILKRMGFTVENTDPAAIESLKGVATTEYIKLMGDEGFIDTSDSSELYANPSVVQTLDSFRFFFVGGLLLPAYQKIQREARKRVESEITALGIPRKTNQTVLNQVMGDTPKNFKKLYKKLMRDAAAEGIPSDLAQGAFDRVKNSFSVLDTSSKVEGDMVAIALGLWNKSSPARKRRILTQALSETTGHQGDQTSSAATS